MENVFANTLRIQMKMYVLVKRSLPSHKCIGIAHGVLMAHLKYQDAPSYKDWLKNSFRKVICEVSDEQFEAAKKVPQNVVVTESGLGGIEVALVFSPREVWPREFRYFSLMKV